MPVITTVDDIQPPISRIFKNDRRVCQIELHDSLANRDFPHLDTRFGNDEGRINDRLLVVVLIVCCLNDVVSRIFGRHRFRTHIVVILQPAFVAANTLFKPLKSLFRTSVGIFRVSLRLKPETGSQLDVAVRDKLRADLLDGDVACKGRISMFLAVI